MKALISPISPGEALIALKGGADIVDIKNVKEGSLGAQFPWVIREMVAIICEHGAESSATLGDLPYKPGTAAQAALGAASCGVNYIKAGLHGLNTFEQALDMLAAIRQAVEGIEPRVSVVASGYADYQRFGGLSPEDLVKAATQARADVVMVDTAIKDGRTLFDAMSNKELQAFVQAGHEAGLLVALAGSVQMEHIAQLQAIGPDIVGVRGAVCDKSDRMTTMHLSKVQEFVARVRQEGLETPAVGQQPAEKIAW